MKYWPSETFLQNSSYQPKQPKEWLNRTVIGVHIQEKVLILPVVL
jgi:hypothetical protein